MAMTLESWHKCSNIPSINSLVVNEARQLDRTNALCFLQCFDTVGPVTGGISDPYKPLLYLYLKVHFRNKKEEHGEIS